MLGIDGHMDGLEPPDFGGESKFIHHHIIEHGKDRDDVFEDDHLFLKLLEVGRKGGSFDFLKLPIFRGVAGEWVVVLGVLFFVLLVELGKGEHRRMNSL